MGGNSSSNGGGEGPANRYQKPPEPKKKNPVVDFIKGGGIIGAVGRSIKKSFNQTKERKINDSLLGTSDYQGDVSAKSKSPTKMDNSGGNNEVRQVTQVTQVPKTIISPTTAEVSQSEEINSGNQEDSIYLKKKKIKAKGRSATILTSSKGVDESLTLGKKSLLGS